ncbi:MAG: hypothetical protein WCK05_15275 [Planctomycetota bacterium]|jgi:hypothetical protein
MLILQQAQGKPVGGQGRSSGRLAELRAELTQAPALSATARQRLAELAVRVARVQALGDEYAGIALSPMATAAVAERSITD